MGDLINLTGKGIRERGEGGERRERV